ncbi:MAG: YqhA family protein [Betaproteobacteria bacterium]
MIRSILTASRYLVLAAVLGSLAASLALFAYGVAETAVVIFETVAKAEVSSKGGKALALAFIEIVDLFLLGTVLLMIALGFYELFIDPDLKLPEWLQIRNFDDLKNKLVGVVIVVLGVMFLGFVVAWDGSRDLLGIGVAIALVIAALTYFLSTVKGGKPDKAVKAAQDGGSGKDPIGGGRDGA